MPEEHVPYGDDPSLARHGWSSSFPDFSRSTPAQIVGSIADFVRDFSTSQRAAWVDSVPRLQREVREVLEQDRIATGYSAILEYELPLEHRRPDVVLLINGAVLVLELKGKLVPTLADIDQAAGYARDLRGYHRECADRPVHPFLVLTEASGELGAVAGVRIVGPDVLDKAAEELTALGTDDRISMAAFLSEDAYRPLPTLVEAARELFEHGTLRRIKRAEAATQPAVDAITEIVHEAASTSGRHLVLLTGVPGSGKTLVGLQAVHARFLDDLAVPRSGGRPTAPAVYLSGNGPLVQVLQYELRGGSGEGKTFVRAVKPFVTRYARDEKAIPPEHVLVFDEAQRAFSAEKMAAEHRELDVTPSEPEQFIQIADRIPGWSVVIGLIGSGQEIHEGEEEGVSQWLSAIERSNRTWDVHGTPDLDQVVTAAGRFRGDKRLSLDTAVRFHLAPTLHRFVGALLDARPASELGAEALELEGLGCLLRVTRRLEDGRAYLRARYADQPDARYGLIASSRDKDLAAFGVPNGWHETQRLKYGPWFGDGRESPLSCTRLDSCVTEFGCQGLELNAALLGWGSDLLLEHGRWSNRRARSYARGSLVRDAMRLRLNAYRVLLTRSRDATVVFVPPLEMFDETYDYLVAAGFRQLEGATDAEDAGAGRLFAPPDTTAAAEGSLEVLVRLHEEWLRNDAAEELPAVLRMLQPRVEFTVRERLIHRTVYLPGDTGSEALRLESLTEADVRGRLAKR